MTICLCFQFQHIAVRQMSSGKRNVHHTRTSASLDEHQEDSDFDSDSDSDDEEKQRKEPSRVRDTRHASER